MQVYGIDLSKEKFDVNFIDAKGKEKNQEVRNAVASISRFLSSVSEDGILCAEHTGAYGDLLVYLCNQMGVDEDIEPITELGGGSIVIHKSKIKKGASVIDPMAKVSIYPNPFDKSIYVDFFSESTHDIIIDLVDMNGRVIEFIYTGIVKENVEHQFELNTKLDLTPGYYMLRIRTKNGELLTREMIMKH